MGTFSKSLASLGGFIAGDADVIHYIKHTARPLMFSASPTPANTAAAMKALEIIEAEPERVQRLHQTCDRVRTSLDRMGYDTMGSQTAIVPILIGNEVETFRFWKQLGLQGLFANPVVHPATPPGKGLIRTSYMATHTREDIDAVLEVFASLAPSRIKPIAQEIGQTG
jgi:7-keto-8-aminopelargonate synthetase-like enzyme